ncbi:putative cytochrome P450, partial [Tanacetum coccineum]
TKPKPIEHLAFAISKEKCSQCFHRFHTTIPSPPSPRFFPSFQALKTLLPKHTEKQSPLPPPKREKRANPRERPALIALKDIFAGGTEPSSATIEMTISELVRNPRVMKKVQIEVTEIAQGRSMIAEEDLENMHYLKAVMINAWAIARDPASWLEPTKFKPERFLTNSMNYKGHHFEWLPFGVGQRECAGIQFAVIELALANIVYKFDFELPNGIKDEDLDMSETFGIVLRRKSPLMIIPKPRC